MASYPFYQIDAFTDKALKGNPAAVMPMGAFLSEAEMQAIAAENNLAETAFIVPAKDDCWHIRWFTPTNEIELCGHATLASAHTLNQTGKVNGQTITFHTQKKGDLFVSQLADGRLEMDFPAHASSPISPPQEVAEILGEWPSRAWSGPFMLVEMDTPEQVKNLTPDMEMLKKLSFGHVGDKGCLIVSARSKDEYDVVSRVFVPEHGIPEDPTTGSAHCMIAPLFSDKLGKAELNCFQAYPGRGGVISTRVENDRVKLIGHSVTVIEGVFHL